MSVTVCCGAMLRAISKGAVQHRTAYSLEFHERPTWLWFRERYSVSVPHPYISLIDQQVRYCPFCGKEPLK